MAANTYTSFASNQNSKKAVTPQTSAIPGRESEMAVNNAGGVTFTLNNWGVLDRFLLLGSESPSYYVGAKDATKQGFDTVKKCIAKDGARVIARILDVSLGGKAPKNDPAVVALALAAVYGNDETKALAYQALPKVARTGTWLFQFVSILDSLGKWNAAAKRGVAAWYVNRPNERLVVQLLKYQSRNGWSHRDVLRLAHIKPTDELMSNTFKYVTGGATAIAQGTNMPALIIAFEQLKLETNVNKVVKIIQDNPEITWEMVPTHWHSNQDVMMSLLPNMGLTAVIRKLGALSAHKLLNPLSDGQKLVVSKIADEAALKAQRIHPIALLQAFKQYQSGQGLKGSLTWKVNQRVLDAINDSFYKAFDLGEATDDNYFIGVDCSGSMQAAHVNGSPNLTAIEVAGVMAMACVKKQKNYWIGGFNTRMGELKISPNQRLDQVVTTMLAFNWGGTDCAQPFIHAQNNNMKVDRFVTITDNETWAGRIQPVQALREYRAKSGMAAKSVVIGTSMTEFTIADPKDSGMLDIAGFDATCPALISSF